MAPKVPQIQTSCKTGECTVSSFCFKTSMALRSNQAALIAPVDFTCGYKAIFSCTDIHKPRLPHSLCFLDHNIIRGVCFGINYHDLVGFRINVKDFGKTCRKKLLYSMMKN
ncbi:unnamed protein product [Malus baccata var. baccata]